jgi:hypothetical protein
MSGIDERHDALVGFFRMLLSTYLELTGVDGWTGISRPYAHEGGECAFVTRTGYSSLASRKIVPAHEESGDWAS